VDHDLRAFGRDEHDHLKRVACGVRADEQPTIGVFSGIFDRERIVDCEDDVLVGDAVSARRIVCVHLLIVVRKDPRPVLFLPGGVTR
jgi:hypothetical protein